jgi:hypothetical protein
LEDPVNCTAAPDGSLSCGNQPAIISLIIVEAAKARPGAKGKGDGERNINLTPVTPYQLGAI